MLRLETRKESKIIVLEPTNSSWWDQSIKIDPLSQCSNIPKANSAEPTKLDHPLTPVAVAQWCSRIL